MKRQWHVSFELTDLAEEDLLTQKDVKNLTFSLPLPVSVSIGNIVVIKIK